MRKLRGFTLVEIMIVVAIISLIAAIAVPNLLRARVNANETSAQATLRSIATALETFESTNAVYPTTTSQLIGATPPYLNKDYFSGVYNGYSFSGTLDVSSYVIVATPVPGQAVTTYTISTGAVLTSTP